MEMLDISEAKKAGWKDEEIVDFLGQSANFDHEAARKAGWTDKEILAHLTKTPGHRMQGAAWQAISAPMRGVAKLGGKLDVASQGTPFELRKTTPEQAEARSGPYGNIATKVLGTGLGGAVSKQLGMGPGIGRIVSGGGLEAATAPPGTTPASAFMQGAATNLIGEGVGKVAPAAATILPGAKARAIIKAAKMAGPQAGPRAGEEWEKLYTYGAVPGATQPMLIRDVLKNIEKPPVSTMGGATGQAAQSGLNVGLNKLRELLAPLFQGLFQGNQQPLQQ
jgi:hypothetical protein